MLARRFNRVARMVPPWVLYVICFAHIGWLFWLGASGELGPDPVEVLEHVYGLRALQLVVVTLSVTPLLRLTRVNLLRFRRALGLSAFAYVIAHFSIWMILDVQALAQVWADIVKRPYITVGMGALLLMAPLAATSNDWSLRRMGAVAWRRLHKLTYPAALLGAIHFVMLRKGFQLEPLLYLGLVILLLAMRMKWSGILRIGRVIERA